MKRVCVDLDGVLNLYDGWKGAEDFAPLRPGAREFLQALRDRVYQVSVHTTRDIDLVWKWLRDNQLDGLVESVDAVKLPAVVYLDDRGMCFTGSFDGVAERIAAFKAHWEKADS